MSTTTHRRLWAQRTAVALAGALVMAGCASDDGQSPQAQRGAERPASVERIRLAGGDFGYPTPFAYVRGPGMIQTSYLTPPMAPAIFYLRAVAPSEITIRHMYAGVVPFIVLQIVILGVVMAFPALVTWLPSVMLSTK